MVEQKRTLTSLLIEPFRQVRFGIYVIGLSTVFLLATAWLFWAAFSEQYQQLMTIFNVVNPEEVWQLKLNSVFSDNAIKISIFFLLYFVSMFSVVFVLTHRYYGPLVSIERFIEELKGGDYSQRMQIRSKDELQSLVKSLNELAAELEKRDNSKS